MPQTYTEDQRTEGGKAKGSMLKAEVMPTEDRKAKDQR